MKDKTSQERFEAWTTKEQYYDLMRAGFGYYSMSTSVAWIAWQAAERDMLERAIAIIDSERLEDRPKDNVDRAHEYALDTVENKLKELLNEPR
jgi:hypothetical protein